eukprot:2785744-Prymnesium_polylepis.1
MLNSPSFRGKNVAIGDFERQHPTLGDGCSDRQSSQSVVEQRGAAQDLSSLRVAESEVQQLDGFRSSSSTTTTGVKR